MVTNKREEISKGNEGNKLVGNKRQKKRVKIMKI